MKKINLALLGLIASITLTACNKAPENDESAEVNAVTATKSMPDETQKTATESTPSLAAILAIQPDDVKARYPARHPQETLEFFGIQPGMTVVEALPGAGWYTKILLPFLGTEGSLIGADYAADMFPKFGFFSAEMIEGKKTWVQTWTAEAEGWRDENSASINAFQFGSMPESMNESADAILFIRALHNLARFESDGGYLTAALSEANRILKPGGIVGVVQHLAPEDSSDDFANGSKGYLKKAFVIEKMQQAGFELVDSSDININPNDQPTAEDIVWRLPPSLATSRENPELKETYQAIGESTRMTLKFRKPAAE